MRIIVYYHLSLHRSPVHPANAVNTNGPVNHVSAGRPASVHGNHITPGKPQLRAHTQALTGQQNGHTDGYNGSQPPPPPGTYPEKTADGGDFTDHNGGGPSYRRYLDVHGEGYCNGEDASPHPSSTDKMPTVVTIEKQPPPGQKLALKKGRDRSPGPGNRDRTPSPRPDIVQEEKFMYPDSQGSSQTAPRRSNVNKHGPTERYTHDEPRSSTLAMPTPQRRLSDSERSEVWKPNGIWKYQQGTIMRETSFKQRRSA